MRHVLSTKTRKTKVKPNTTLKAKKGAESFIYLCTRGGLNDCLVQLLHILAYAQKHRRSILLQMKTYSAADLSSIFDFSQFPVPIYTNVKERLAAFPKEVFEPRVNPLKIQWGLPTQFNLQREYPREKVLLYSKGFGGDGFPLLKYIRFTPEFLTDFQTYRKKLGLPREYVSMHLRATDRKMMINNNVRGISLAESNIIIKTPTVSKDPKKASLEKIERFVRMFEDLPIFTASDNPALLALLKKKYPQMIMSESSFNYNNDTAGVLHKRYGSKDANILKEAFFDLLLLAGGEAIITSAGGFSRLAKKLQVDKALLADMCQS